MVPPVNSQGQYSFAVALELREDLSAVPSFFLTDLAPLAVQDSIFDSLGALAVRLLLLFIPRILCVPGGKGLIFTVEFRACRIAASP
jgi:hypothetical protein